jgi:hypothetical protein
MRNVRFIKASFRCDIQFNLHGNVAKGLCIIWYVECRCIDFFLNVPVFLIIGMGNTFRQM